jgi:hypothetical protein
MNYKRLTPSTLFFIAQSLKPAANWPGAPAPLFVKLLVNSLREQEFERLKEIVGHPTPGEWQKEFKLWRV